MLISHYLHLMQHEGEGFTKKMVIRGTKERLVPVLMTALAAGIGLIPLVLAADQPGKEILHPVAVVIVGGLVSCWSFWSALSCFSNSAAVQRSGRSHGMPRPPNEHAFPPSIPL
jgi:Cu/Ag efflux pump CusA